MVDLLARGEGDEADEVLVLEHDAVAASPPHAPRLVALLERRVQRVLEDALLVPNEPLARVPLPLRHLHGHNRQRDDLGVRVEERGARLGAAVLEVHDVAQRRVRRLHRSAGECVLRHAVPVRRPCGAHMVPVWCPYAVPVRRACIARPRCCSACTIASTCGGAIKAVGRLCSGVSMSTSWKPMAGTLSTTS